MSDESRKAELVTALAKGVLGSVPVVGPMMAEIVGVIIPNQRVDRLKKLVEELARQMELQEIIPDSERMRDPEFVDLLEDGFQQAARATSERRLSYLASVLQEGITDAEFKHLQLKTLLSILAQVNDIEILILASYSMSYRTNRAFHGQHEEVLTGTFAHINADQQTRDDSAIYKTHRANLERLRLLEARYTKPRPNQPPEFDEHTGRLKASGWHVTNLGELLLRCIEFERHESTSDGRATAGPGP